MDLFEEVSTHPVAHSTLTKQDVIEHLQVLEHLGILPLPPVGSFMEQLGRATPTPATSKMAGGRAMGDRVVDITDIGITDTINVTGVKL